MSARLAAWVLIGAIVSVGCAPSAEPPSRRAFAGAPPTLPHEDDGRKCESCHRPPSASEAVVVPPSPHGLTAGMGEGMRCRQCHVALQVDTDWRASTFVGSSSPALEPPSMPGAPPVVPHRMFMREDCAACHVGSSAAEPIRTSHPERVNCLQCHAQTEA